MVVDDFYHRAEEEVEYPDDPGRRLAFDQRGETTNVTDQDADMLLVVAVGVEFMVAQDLAQRPVEFFFCKSLGVFLVKPPE